MVNNHDIILRLNLVNDSSGIADFILHPILTTISPRTSDPLYIVIYYKKCGHFLDNNAISPRSSYPFYIVTYYMNWVTSSWTYSIYSNRLSQYLTFLDPSGYLISGCFWTGEHRSQDPYCGATEYPVPDMFTLGTHARLHPARTLPGGRLNGFLSRPWNLIQVMKSGYSNLFRVFNFNLLSTSPW